MTVLVTLSGVGSSAGPTFDLYSSPNGITFTVFASGINKTVLVGGYQATVPNGTTHIKVTSVGVCTNSNVAIISVTPTTSTSTSTSTSTTSTSTSSTTTTTTTIPTVVICDQEWTLYNLDVETYSDGTIIPEVTGNVDWRNLTTGAWCYYENNTFYGNRYMKLYNWYAVAGIHDAASLANPALRKTLALDGYHIPTTAEWYTLQDCLGGNLVAGGKMKSTGTLYWQSPNVGATNSSGFTGLPGGQRGYNNAGDFGLEGIQGKWWSIDNNVSVELNAQNDNLYISAEPEYIGMSVRLIKD